MDFDLVGLNAPFLTILIFIFTCLGNNINLSSCIGIYSLSSLLSSSCSYNNWTLRELDCKSLTNEKCCSYTMCKRDWSSHYKGFYLVKDPLFCVKRITFFFFLAVCVFHTKVLYHVILFLVMGFSWTF